jgi:Na+/proline symporter
MVFFLGGFSGFWIMGWATWVIWMPLVAVIWAKMWRRLGVVTTGELIERRYGGRTARVFRNVFAIYACSAWGLTLLAYGAAWMAASVRPLLGWPGRRVLLVFSAVTLVYPLISGLFGVAYNDALQFLLVLAGNGIFAHGMLENLYSFPEVAGVFPLRTNNGAMWREYRRNLWNWYFEWRWGFEGWQNCEGEPLSAEPGMALQMLRMALIRETVETPAQDTLRLLDGAPEH